MTVKLATNMKSTDILNKTLGWLYSGEQNTAEGTWDIFGFLNLLSIKNKGDLIGLELAERGYLHSYEHFENRSFHNPANVPGSYQAVPQHVHAFTQVILHTLNCDSLKFHDMSEIPGLENKSWDQLSEFAHYLLKQGWIEVKNKDNKLYIKLTIQGNLYLRSHDTAA